MTKSLNHKLLRSIDDLGLHFIKLVNSGLYFAITFIVLHYLGHAWSTANAWHYGYSPMFSYAGMDSLLGTTGWTARRVAIVHLMPPFVGVLGLLAGVLLFHISGIRKTQIRTFSFWLAFSGLLLYVSYLVTGVLSGLNFNSEYFTGFVGYYAWLYWEDSSIYGMLLLQFILCLPVVYILSRMCFRLSYSKGLLKNQERKVIMCFHVLFAPATIGSIIILAATFPMDASYQLVRLLVILPVSTLVVLGTFLQSGVGINPIKGGFKPLSLIGVIILMTTVIFLSRTVLSLRTGPFW